MEENLSTPNVVLFGVSGFTPNKVLFGVLFGYTPNKMLFGVHSGHKNIYLHTHVIQKLVIFVIEIQ